MRALIAVEIISVIQLEGNPMVVYIESSLSAHHNSATALAEYFNNISLIVLVGSDGGVNSAVTT